MATYSKSMRDHSTRCTANKVDDLLRETAEEHEMDLYKFTEIIPTEMGFAKRIDQSYSLDTGDEEVEFEAQIYNTLEPVEDMQGINQKNPIEKLRDINNGRPAIDGKTRVVRLSSEDISGSERYWEDFNDSFEHNSMSDHTITLGSDNYHLYGLP